MDKSPYVNAVDACAAGTSDGLSLALNVAAMLIVFIAFVAMFDAILSSIRPLLIWAHIFTTESAPAWMTDLSLSKVFGWVFSPVAFLMGVVWKDASTVGSLLGTKLAINEHVAFLQMKAMLPTKDAVTGAVTAAGQMSERSFQLAAFALTGFANFSSVGIQLGGIGGMAPNRRHDLARLGMRALFVGFTATLLNASIAGILLPSSTDAAPPPAATATATGANQDMAIPTGDAIPEKSDKSSPAADKAAPKDPRAKQQFLDQHDQQYARQYVAKQCCFSQCPCEWCACRP